MKNKIKVSIVIPCLNEEKTISIVIKKGLDSFRRLRIAGEVLVSDNGSKDNSIFIAQKEGARVVNCPQRGYGSALICGFNSAKGDYLIMGDADDSYDFSHIENFLKYLDEGYDIVIGTRLKGKIEKGAMPFLHRYLGTPVLTFILNLFFKTKITDCNCGMRGLTKTAFRRLDLKSSGMEFASEMIIKAGILKLKIKEIPITLYKDKRERPPHLNTWRDGWRHLKFMLLYAPNFVFIWPSLFLFIVGTLLMLLQMNGPFIYNHFYMDIHFLILGLTMSIIGITTFQMGMIIKLYSHLNNFYINDKLVAFIKGVSLEKSLLLGGFALIAGIIADTIILIEWIENDFSNIQLSRLAIFGLYFIFVGLSIIFFSFLRAIMDRE